MMREAIALSLAMSIGLVGAAFQQGAPPVAIVGTEHRQLLAKTNGRSYDLFVALPDEYERDKATRYPAVYITDAHVNFPLITSIYRLLRAGREVPALVLVGITTDASSWATLRRLHLTPTRLQAANQRDETASGGGPDFLRVITEELIPEIERRYRVANDRTFVGSSLGGLFGAYAMFETPNTFRRMLLVSPSLHWDNGVMFTREAKFAAANSALPLVLFVSAGELEGAEVVTNVKRFAAVLRARGYERLILHSHIFDRETHTSTHGVAFTRGSRHSFRLFMSSHSDSHGRERAVVEAKARMAPVRHA